MNQVFLNGKPIDKELVSRNLRLIRNAKQMTAQQLSAITGIKERRFYSIEGDKKNPSAGELTLICEALGVKFKDLCEKEVTIKFEFNEIRPYSFTVQ